MLLFPASTTLGTALCCKHTCREKHCCDTSRSKLEGEGNAPGPGAAPALLLPASTGAVRSNAMVVPQDVCKSSKTCACRCVLTGHISSFCHWHHTVFTTQMHGSPLCARHCAMKSYTAINDGGLGAACIPGKNVALQVCVPQKWVLHLHVTDLGAITAH